MVLWVKMSDLTFALQSLKSDTSNANIKGTRGHTLRLKKKQSVKDVRRYFFSQRVMNRWNSLDQETVDVGSINSFKGRLDKIRKTRMGFFVVR